MRQPTESEWTKIQELFDQMLERSPDERESALAGTSEDSFITDRVRAMIVAVGESGVLDTIASTDQIESNYSSLPQGAEIGAFRIVRLIGRGGMGEVYLAERISGFEQRVALKLLRPEAAGRMAMFDAERQLLAQLEHPGIARLIDGGIAPDGRPYMALEYVEGDSITAWCAGRMASVEKRLELLLAVCDAVAYAHARLVIHRDIKPANILVDRDGRPRLVDFGIAKIADGAIDDRAVTQALLTPDFAAPEQFRSDPSTVATDVYALGGVLYALLVGEGAWARGKAQAIPGIGRLLHDDPIPPSQAASARVTSPVTPERMRGDLDAIVLKAMRYEPDARYDSVASMGADIRRHLAFEPVDARAGSFGYQLRRFVQRHRAATAAGVIALTALVLGTVGVAWQAQRVRVERDIAQTQAERAAAVNQAVVLMFRNAQQFGKGESETASGLLNDSARRVVASFEKDSADSAAVVLALSELYIEINDVVGAQTLLRTALNKGVGQSDRSMLARLQNNLGTVDASMGEFDEAVRLLDAADNVWRTNPLRFRKERLESGAARAQMWRLQGRREEAIALLLASQPEAEAEYAKDPNTLLTRYNNLAVHLAEAQRLDELDEVLRRAERLMQRSHLTNTAMGISMIQLRGGWHNRRNDYAGALPYMHRAAELRRTIYGPSAALAQDLLQEGLTLQHLDRYTEASIKLEEAHTLSLRYIGATSPLTGIAAASLAGNYAHQGNIAAARRSLAAAGTALVPLAPDNPIYIYYLLAQAQLAIAERHFGAADQDIQAADALRIRSGAVASTMKAAIDDLRALLKATRAKTT